MRVHAKGYAKKSVLQAPFMDLPEVAGNLYWFYPVTRLMRGLFVCCLLFIVYRLMFIVCC